MLYKLLIRLNRPQKRQLMLALDVLLAPLSLALACLLLNERTFFATATYEQVLMLMASCAAFSLGMTAALGLHRVRLNSYEMSGVGLTSVASVVVAFATSLVSAGFGWPISVRVWVAFSIILIIASVASRAAIRQILLALYRQGEGRIRVLIYGAGHTGQQLAAALRTDRTVEPVGFVDDNPTLQSLSINGLRVYSPLKIKELFQRYNVDRVILAMPSTSRPRQQQIARRLREMGCETKLLPSFAEMMQRSHGESRRIDHTAILNRSNLEDELPRVYDGYTDRVVMVTGAGGSIGSELCRQLLDCKPSKLILLDHSEFALYAMMKELAALRSTVQCVPLLMSVTDRPALERVMRQHKVQIVLHAAAYKHVPMVENNALAGLKNNVLGTKAAAEAARTTGVERFILVSTDKAVRPSNVMGASKRLAELVVQDLATRCKTTRYSMVRFGNVLGSSGSIIPLFEEQIAMGGPVTVTHPDVTRYFMTIPEASRLVLLAGSFARGGDVFVLDMGKPVRIAQVARQMIEAAGYSVRDDNNSNGDIEIRYIGLRKGEKLHEELLIGQDMLTTPHPKILRAREGHLSEIEVAAALAELRNAIEVGDTESARNAVFKWAAPKENRPAILAEKAIS
ncbi:MAG: nucleoside-diphosphate sugar epimerase/dehydratase [Pseudomonadota bacterium]|nr:nucleoside-diphosphate sugar epimerase/dehydratase [Pseudomonadota bacterium]MEE3069760.1 nucleoside-diphosphate sugar epimerase/dehydratase [Pseudomonadota bacterium]